MDSIETDLYGPAFESYGMHEVPVTNQYGPAGKLYSCEGEHGRGTYWVYFHGNQFAVNAFDMAFSANSEITCPHTEHIIVSVYESGMGLEYSQGKDVIPYIIQTYIGNEGGLYRARCKKNAVMRGTSITISPDYYDKALAKRFGAVPDIRQAFKAIDGASNFPELTDLLLSIRSYKGSGMAAELFYEGIVSEALALIIDRHATSRSETPMRLSAETQHVMGCLALYIAQNLERDLSCANLAHRCCMSMTTFKHAFKEYFGQNPGDYVTKHRMQSAQELLADSTLSIAEIARSVGYRKPGAFSEAYRRQYGCTPRSVRSKRSAYEASRL